MARFERQRSLFAAGVATFSVHVADHVVTGDEAGALFTGCLALTAVLVGLCFAPSEIAPGLRSVVGVAAGIVITLAGLANHIVLALVVEPSVTDRTGWLSVVGGLLILAGSSPRAAHLSRPGLLTLPRRHQMLSSWAERS